MARFLVVDDEPDIGLMLRLNLEQWGHEVVVATSAEEAFTHCAAAGPPDAMLLDMSMPGENGAELVRRLRAARCAPAEIALLSAATRAQLARVARELGVRLLAKPFQLEDLRALTARMVAGAPEPD